MNLNEKRQEIIGLAMWKMKVNKLQLSKALNMSYPTMLSKLKDTGNFKLCEADELCNYLNINLTELITLNTNIWKKQKAIF